jgi:uncharacterized protein YxeA
MKKVLIAVVIVVVVVVAALAIIPHFLDLNSYRTQIQAKLQEASATLGEADECVNRRRSSFWPRTVRHRATAECEREVLAVAEEGC